MKKTLLPLLFALRLCTVFLVLACPSAWAAAVTSIARQSPGPVVAGTSIVFRVTFDAAVTGVTTGAFTLTTTGTAAGTVASVASVGGSIYDVTVNGLAGVGTLRLDLSDGAGLSPAVGSAFTAGQSYLTVPAGTVAYSWGLNTYGQLGNNSTTQSTVPVAVNTSGALFGKTLVALADGTYHSLALASDGTVYAWGYNSSGQLGDSSTADATPRKLPVAVDTSGALAGKTVIAIAGGYNHSLALASDGQVYAWGISYGQSGDTSSTKHLAPVAVDTTGALAGKTVIAIAAGNGHSLALASDGTVYAWGDDSSGQLGDNYASGGTSSVPVAVITTGALAGKTVVAIAAGDKHSLALASDGTVYAWGLNTYGRLGDNSTVSRLAPVAVNTTNGTSALYNKTVIAIAAGGYHSLALASDGTVCAWGFNSSGQLGNNSTTQSTVPVAVNTAGGTSALSGKTVIAVTAGLTHSLALAADGTLCAWGSNLNGRLGDNSTTNRLVPVAAVAGSLTFRALALMGDASHSLALATVPAPTVTNLSPTRGLTTGGTTVVITGANFTGANAVTFGTTPATGFTVNSATQITATAPAVGSAGAVDVTVTTIGGTSATSAADSFTYVLPLTITSVGAPGDGTYGAGQSLNFTINFSAAVTVTGTPRLALTIGGVTRYANYVSGDGTAALVFSYTVQAGDGAPGGLAVVSPLQLNSGTIVDAATTAATLTFTPPVTTGVHVATAPLAPTVAAAVAGDGLAVVRFTAPASDGGSAITSYTVTSNPGNFIATGAGLSLTVTGLTNGTAYTFTVTATNSVGPGATSAASAAVTPNRSWAMNFGTAAGDQTYVVKTTTDAAGNVYIAGYFYGSTLAVGQTTLTRIGARDAFVAKLSPQGSALWARNYGGTGANASFRGLALDTTGHVYLGGYFSAASLTTPALTKIGTTDALVVKLDPTDGSLVWAQNYGGAGARALGCALGLDAAGNVYLAGCMSTAALTPAPGVTLPPIGTEDALVMKLAAANGAVLWGKNYGGAGATTNFNALGVDAAGNVYPGGYFAGADLTAPAIARLGLDDALVMKLAADGTFAWANRYGGAGAAATVQAVAVTAEGVYVGGYMDSADLTAPAVARIGSSDALVMKLAATDGATAWTKNFGGVGANTQGWALATDAANNVYLGGFFGSADLTSPALARIGTQDSLMIKLSPSGGLLAAKNYGGAGANTDLKGLAVDATGNLYLVGGFSSSNLTAPALTKIGAYDSLLIKEAAPPSPAIGSVTAPANAIYRAGEVLEFTVNYDAAVTVTGTPRLSLTVGSTTRYAACVPGSSTPTALVFRYTVATGDADPDGIALASPLDLNSGTIVATSTGGAATLTLNNVASTAGVRVDAAAPAAPTLTTASTVTTNLRPVLSGTAEAGSTVKVYAGGTTLIATVTAHATTGAWTFTPSSDGAYGTYALTATATDAAGNVSSTSAVLTLTIEEPAPPSKDPQAITFAAPGNKLNTDAPFSVHATASSGLPVSFSLVSGPASLSGNTVTLTGMPGTVTLRASQSGDDRYDSATDVSRSFTVSLATPVMTTSTHSSSPSPGCTATLDAGTDGISGLTCQWQRNGANLSGATSSALTLTSVQPAVAGLYTYSVATTTGAAMVCKPVILGVATTEKVTGSGNLVGADIPHPNGNVYDQLILAGPGATFTADPGQITRMSFVDLTGDIVQVEFSGAGSLSLVMDNPSAPAPAANYNQPGVNYVRGHAGIVIAGANETTNVSVVSVGRMTAVNPSLFRADVTYDGVADIAFLAIQSANGKFGGVRTGNVGYFATQGFTGLYAPDVTFTGPVNIGDIQAHDQARPVLVLGSASDVCVTGGSLAQPNGARVQVGGLFHLKFSEGRTSDNKLLPVQSNRAVFEQDGVDVTTLITAGS